MEAASMGLALIAERGFRLPMLALVALAMGSCTVVLEADGPRCTVREDCAAVGAEPRLCDQGSCVPKSAVPWGCAVEPELDIIGEITINIVAKQQVGDDDDIPLADFTFALCTVGDPSCLARQQATTDSEGRARIRVNRRFGIYLEAVHPSPEYAPQIVQVGPFSDRREVRFEIGFIMRPWAALAFDDATIPDLSQTRSHMFVSLEGCPGWTAAGAAFSLPDLNAPIDGPFYRLPLDYSSIATETRDNGEAMYLNIDAPAAGIDRQFTRLLATEVATGIIMMESLVTLRRGWVTQVVVSPLRNIPLR